MRSSLCLDVAVAFRDSEQLQPLLGCKNTRAREHARDGAHTRDDHGEAEGGGFAA